MVLSKRVTEKELLLFKYFMSGDVLDRIEFELITNYDKTFKSYVKIIEELTCYKNQSKFLNLLDLKEWLEGNTFKALIWNTSAQLYPQGSDPYED